MHILYDPIHMKIKNSKSLEIESLLVVAQSQQWGEESNGFKAEGYEVSFEDDKDVLGLSLVMVVHTHEYTENHQIIHLNG